MMREWSGPRVELKVDLRQAQRGQPIPLAGDRAVMNLDPGEAEALRFRFEASNSLSLVVFEAQIVGSRFLTANDVSLAAAVVFAAASDQYEGLVAVIDKRDLLAPLLEPDGVVAEIGELSSEMIAMLSPRGAGFLSNGDLRTWTRLKGLYEGGEPWGSIVASFAEYARDHDVAEAILADLDGWLSSPERIREAIGWDNESRAITTLDNRLQRIAKKRRGEYLLRLLENTISPFPTAVPDGEKGFKTIFGQTALSTMRDRAAEHLVEQFGAGAVETILAALAAAEGSSNFSEILERVTGFVPGHSKDWMAFDERLREWLVWWHEEGANYPSALPLTSAPRLYRAMQEGLANLS
jgi:hypothetical protein